MENKEEEQKSYMNDEEKNQYGDFICSYFTWVSIPEQRKKAEELQNMTNKDNQKINKNEKESKKINKLEKKRKKKKKGKK